MTASPDPDTQAAVVCRLRTAGCVYAEDEARLLIAAARSVSELDAMVGRRAAGEPVEHLVGWAEFCGLRIAVDPGVFVPRRRSEFLAREAVRLARDSEGSDPGGNGLVAVDLCCGSGAFGAVLAAAVPGIGIHAVDVDPDAVACARRNLAPVGAQVHWGDLYRPLPRSLIGRVSVVVANTPYVPSGAIGTLPAEAREHEPRVALDGGPDGLDIARRVLAEAPRWLAPGGHVLVETGERQADTLARSVSRSGLRVRLATSAELDATIVIGGMPIRRG